MKSFFKGLAVVLAVLGCCLRSGAYGAAPAAVGTQLFDVVLTADGVLLGQVLDPQARPRALVPVSIYASGREIGRGVTDNNGYFAFRGLTGGTYQLAAVGGVSTYRVWSRGAAPATAQPGVLVVAGQDLSRGQLGWARFWLSHPYVLGGLAGAAIGGGIALAIEADDDDEPATP
jgi:hypothetical protein